MVTTKAPRSLPSLIAYLEATIIPDLRGDGCEVTADDFAKCAEFMRGLVSAGPDEDENGDIIESIDDR